MRPAVPVIWISTTTASFVKDAVTPPISAVALDCSADKHTDGTSMNSAKALAARNRLGRDINIDVIVTDRKWPFPSLLRSNTYVTSSVTLPK
jgi:hypothetical protein